MVTMATTASTSSLDRPNAAGLFPNRLQDGRQFSGPIQKKVTHGPDVDPTANEILQGPRPGLIAHDHRPDDPFFPDQDPHTADPGIGNHSEPLCVLTPGLAIAAREGDQVIIDAARADRPNDRRGHS